MKRSPMKKKKLSQKTLRKQLQAKAWSLMSKYVRLRDGKCITCGSTTTLQAGHFLHGKLDFDFQNIHAQCSRCNKWLNGNLAKYATFLVREYGYDILDELERKSKEIFKPTPEDYEAIISNLNYLLDSEAYDR